MVVLGNIEFVMWELFFSQCFPETGNKSDDPFTILSGVKHRPQVSKQADYRSMECNPFFMRVYRFSFTKAQTTILFPTKPVLNYICLGRRYQGKKGSFDCCISPLFNCDKFPEPKGTLSQKLGSL
jgi:hypothetical protein